TRRLPEGLPFDGDNRRRDLSHLSHRSLPLHGQPRTAVTRAELQPGALRQREVAILHLSRGMRLTAELPHRFDDFGHVARVRWVVVAQAAAVGVERQLADTGNQIAVGDEFAAGAPFAE